jgi:spore maturation protein CgeB
MKVLMIGAFPDRVNTNALLRRCAAEGFRALPEVGLVADACPEQHAAEIAAQRWDLVVFMGSILLDGFELHPRIDRAREQLAPGGRLVLWLHDDPYEFDASHRCDGLFDRVYTTDPTAVLHYRRREPVGWLPLAASPVLHYRPPAAPVEAWDYLFCGAAFENRVALLRRIEADGFRGRVFGTGWPPRLRAAVNARLSAADLADYYNAAPVTLVLGRSLDLRNRQLRLRQSIFGPRVYEAAMAGAAQLFLEGEGLLFGEFEAGTHLLVADDPAAMTEALRLLLSDAAENLRMRRAASEQAMARHTYAHRARQMIDELWP